LVGFYLLDEGHCSVDQRLYFGWGAGGECGLGLVELIESLCELMFVDFDDALCDELVVLYVLVFGGVFLSHDVVLDGECVLVLHEVAVGSVEVVELVEVGSDGVVQLLHFIQVIHSFVYFAFHHENHALCEEFEFIDVGGVDLEVWCAVDVVVGGVEIAVLYF
jgi:hypothetical protein